MRIGSGRLRGRRVQTPPGSRTRPTSGRLKKALFDILAPRLAGARVLDLYAGAGALGLEALSRGASWATFVERGRVPAEAIRKNLAALGLAGQGEVLRREVRPALAFLAERGRGAEERSGYDVVFVDPPYGADVQESVLRAIATFPLLSLQAVVVLEHHHKTPIAETCGELERVRRVR
ncbi:MAG: 16S rRNA (guanine(966)-N(2))-methyltransferase RsmD, partial [Acidobacteriota bacterium]